MSKKDPKELLNEPLHGIYIPSFLIIFGIGIHSISLVPYAILVVAIFWAVRIALVYRKFSLLQH